MLGMCADYGTIRALSTGVTMTRERMTRVSFICYFCGQQTTRRSAK